MEDLKVLELFAGIGACSKALTNLGIPHTVVDAVEIDKYAVKSFNAVHGTNFEPQDITKWDKDVEVDLIMHGSPCQDFSVAGLQAGGDKDSGTRSSLMYETLRIVEELKPKYVIWENVKNLLSKKHKHNFDDYIRQMELLGYNSTYQVLNAKDYGVPQNRERVFTISIRKDLPFDFHFPAPLPPVKLKDVLESDVEEKYYLSDEQVASFQNDSDKQQAKGNGFKFSPRDPDTYATCISTRAGGRKTDNFIKVVGRVNAISCHDILKRVYSPDGCSPTLSTMGGGNTEPKITVPIKTANKQEVVGIVEDFYKSREPRVFAENAPTLRADRQGLKVAIRTANKQGFDMATDGDGIDLAYPDSKTRRGRVGHGVSKTIMTSDSMGTLETDGANYRIRKLTPKECWRLMGFADEDFEKAAKLNSNTQLYKQAGNSIVVDVLYNIFKELL